MADVAVIGLGSMGMSLSRALTSHGHAVTGCDLALEAIDRAAGIGVAPAASPRAAVHGAELVFTVLPGPDAVRRAVLDPDDGALRGLATDAPLLDMTTAQPALARELGAAFSTAGRTFVDAPVSGRAPRMTVLLGARAGALGCREQIVRDVSDELVYCGEPGAGYAIKLLNQQVKYGWYLASCEALAVAERIGLDPALVAAAIGRCSGGSSGLSDAAEWSRGDREAVAGHGPARTIAKDMRLARGLAQDAGVDAASLRAVADFFTQVDRTPLRDRPYPESAQLLARTPGPHS